MKIFSVLLLSGFLAFSLQTNAAEQTQEDMKQQVLKVQKELDELVEQGGKYAYLQLAQKNSLSPFAVAVDESGTTIMLEVPKKEEKASFSDKILKLREMIYLGGKNAKFVAGALFVQAQVPHMGKEVDGVAIEMEHKMGLSVLRFSPYEVNREDKKISFKRPVDKVKPVVFFKEAVNQDPKS
ncbi:hypothetical protein QNI23_005060 [Bermanella sp. WJH001]|uniref:hypothetical protein n=1 Tax=Bermanella sp. WJH001 TaxID=3048005 RepID=UPI0024BE0E4D|nr:hypothetical protein [Bermanella sp. WJH001]MDJ1539852.1 hypothetical protein [Bermanella sp. WJH001]